MPRVPLLFPFAGRTDDLAHHAQPELTTRSAQNVRARDPVSGRLRGAQRSGLSKWNPNQIGTGRIRALVSTAIDDRKLAYTFTGTETEVWSARTPNKAGLIPALATDSQGNVYAIDGLAGIVKYNSAGRELLKIALPVADPGHTVRALTVDSADRIFAAVSSGGDVATARMWGILQLPDDGYHILWQFEPGAYTEALSVYRESQLYAAHNYPTENRSRVLVYDGILLDPVERRRIETVAYPVRAMVQGADGSVYCASDTGEQAGLDGTLREGVPGAPREHAPVVGWTIWDLENARQRVWGYWDADAIRPEDVEDGVLEDGKHLLIWRDLSGNGRHWYAGTIFANDEIGPQLNLNGPGGLMAVNFENVGTIKQSMVTERNASLEKSLARQQRSSVPSYEGSMWAAFFLLQPTQEADTVSPNPRAVWYAENSAAGASNHGLWVNRACGATEPGTYSQGMLSYFAQTDVAPDDGQCPTADQPLSYDFTFEAQEVGCVLVTILWDGGVDPANNAKTRCLVRVNGRPVDRFEGLAFQALTPNYLGYAPSVATAVERRYRGRILKMLVLDRIDRFDNSTEPKVLTHDQLEQGSASAHQTDTEVCRIEAWMLYERGLAGLLEERKDGALPPNRYGHFYAYDVATDLHRGPPAPTDGGLSTPHAQIIHAFPLLSKHDSQGRLLWVCNEETHPDTGTNRGGIGYGVAVRKVDETTHVWSTGPDALQVGASDVAVRKIIDQGESFSGLAADGAWRHKYALNADQTYVYPRLAADKFGNGFVPASTSQPPENGLYVFKKDPDGSGNAQILSEINFAEPNDDAYAVVLPPDALVPDYRDDLATEVSDVVYFTIAPGTPGFGELENLFKYRLVDVATQTTGSPRTLATLCVVEDDVRIVTESSSVIPSGGTAAVDANAQYVQALRAGEDLVVIDGVRVLAYSLRDGTVAELLSESAGEVPPRPKLGMYWRHRLLLGAFADNSDNYAASRLGNIRDWNRRPGVNLSGQPIQTSTQAFTGTATRAGEAEDSIVAMIPVWDDLAFIVCESRILRLTGDPQDGGNIHKVTDSLGGVFGDSWCKDSEGRVFIFGNAPPGLYLLRVDGDPVPISRHTLEETEFADIDFSTHRVVLAWNPIDKGVHIFQVAWGTASIVSHWFWEERTHRLVRNPPLWTDRFYAAGKQPSAVTYLGGDDTRCLLLGCEDGYIRKWDPAAETDDGDPIDSFFTKKVSPEGGPYAEWLLRTVQVALASDQSGARLEIFGSETADDLGPVMAATQLGAGLNEEFRARVRGNHLFVRLRNAADQRWALETATVDIQGRGKQVPSAT